jgi:hypothetical protein
MRKINEDLREDSEVLKDMEYWGNRGYYRLGSNEKIYNNDNIDEDEDDIRRDSKFSYYIINDIIRDNIIRDD